MRSQKINRLLPIYISIVPLKFDVDIESQTKVSPETKISNMATMRQFWKWRLWKSIGSYPYIYKYCATLNCNWTLFKITRQSFWKRHSWQSLGFRLQPQRTCTWNLKLKFQSKLALHCRNHAIQKPKNLIWPPGGHFESDVTENQ